MPIGRPDWYLSGLSQNIASVNDTGELAVRLGSPVNFDRTGKVLYQTTFPTMANVSFAALNTLLVAPHITPLKFKYGCSSVHATIDNGIANGLNFSYSDRVWNNELISTEFGILTDQLPSQVLISIVRHLPGLRRYFAIKYINGMTDLQVRKSDGTYETFYDGSNILWPSNIFNTIKLDFNLEDYSYVRYRHNSETYDLSAYSTFSDTSGVYNFLAVSVSVYASATIDTNVYFDHYILSADE
jgi:hypothetical protein